jgi:hypothetical protein
MLSYSTKKRKTEINKGRKYTSTINGTNKARYERKRK